LIDYSLMLESEKPGSMPDDVSMPFESKKRATELLTEVRIS